MKTTKKLLMIAILTVAFTPAIQSRAQFKTADDGIAASPKLRAQLDERKTVSPAESAPVVAAKPSDDGVAASPKLRAQLGERKAAGTAASSANVASTTRVEDDGIAASPKLREQLREQKARFEIAPIK
jgi:hypothetical protein